jgi:decaprenylphospho-beta-D-ribofuranose 2-oxidase
MWLFAPHSGRETRRRLRQRGSAVVDQLKRTRSKSETDPNMREISNWGNYPRPRVRYFEFDNLDNLHQLVTSMDDIIARGNGGCYGDSALARNVISTLRYNKFLNFDTGQGIIHCQSGVILSDLVAIIVEKGWFLPVTPGTKMITVGGAIASDVHGKSQHKTGNFSDHLLEMDIMLADGSIATCSKEQNPELFWTTTGGMGLTGIILHARLQLIPVETAYFKQQSVKAENLDQLMSLFEDSETWPYSVAWIDCITRGEQMGRGIIMRGDHARISDLTDVQKQSPLALKPKLKLNIPVYFPDFALNSISMKIFNTLYYHKQIPTKVEAIVDYNTFFYPLDSILNWNRIYGKRGFVQYQFILPKENSREGVREILQRIVDSGTVSFLAVLKLYGKQNGYLPFAMEGYSLALDFPIVEGLFEFLEQLDQIVLGYGGRLYLTKDARMGQEMFMQSYPGVEKFLAKVGDFNAEQKFRSFQSDRIGVTS